MNIFGLRDDAKSIARVSQTLEEKQIYVNSSGRRFEIEKLDEETVYLAELNDINEKIGARIWSRKTFAQALRNKLFDKSVGRNKATDMLIKRMNLNELMR